MKNIVTSNWLKENIHNDDLVILDVRANFKDYEKEHIKGAQHVSLEEVAADKVSTHGGRTPLPDLHEFVENMKSLGVSDTNAILIYDDGNLSRAGRLWWVFKYIGKKDVFVLEGGIDKWIDNGGETTTETPAVNKSDSLSLNINEKIRVDMEYVKDAINSEDIALVDARAHERYTGEVEPLDIKAGHIPSALNYPWTDLVKDGEILPTDELEKKFEPLKKYDEVIVYCGSGITATVPYLLMEEVGMKPKMYPGSFSDWISYDENEVVVGE
ncbi:MAG: sulfurtransferase [Tissierellaceae bacterium]|nr:sulfurtransferase [Tissierellaceae bacterium]